MEALIREDIARLYAGHPEAMQEAIDDLEENLQEGASEPGETVGLHAANRDGAWAQLGR